MMNLWRNEFKVTFANGMIDMFDESDMNRILSIGGIFKKMVKKASSGVEIFSGITNSEPIGDEVQYSFANGELIPFVNVEIIPKPRQDVATVKSIMISLATHNPYYGEKLFSETPRTISDSSVIECLGKWYIYSSNSVFSGRTPGTCIILAVSDRPVRKVVTRPGDVERHTLGYFVKE